LSPTKPKQDLSHITRPTTPIIEDWVSDYEDESKTKAPQIVPSFVQSSEQVKSSKHSVKPVETSIPAATPKPASPKPTSSGNKKNRKACFVPVSTAVPKIKVTRPRHANPIITKSKSPIRRHITRSPSLKTSNSLLRVTTTKAPVVSAAQGMHGTWVWRPKCPIPDHVSRTTSASMTLKRVIHNMKDKGVIDSGCSRHVTGIMSYLSDFKGLNGGYVAFGGNPKGGKISRKGKIKTC
nr:hypothetical protein [Tanacetum cinerariifolium]